MKFLVALALLLLSSLLLTPPLYAQNSYTEFERGLNLTESQKRRAEGVREKYIEEWRFQRQEALRKRLELNDLRKNPSSNMNRIERTERELRNIERSWERSYGQYRSDLSQVLDERQRMQYNQFTEWERRKRTMPQQGFREPETQRQGPTVPRGFRKPGMQRQAPIPPDKRSFPTKENKLKGREMRGYER